MKQQQQQQHSPSPTSFHGFGGRIGWKNVGVKSPWLLWTTMMMMSTMSVAKGMSLSPLSTRIITQAQHTSLQVPRMWLAYRGNIQLDCVELPDFYVSGKHKLSDKEQATKWNEIIDKRVASLTSFNNHPTTSPADDDKHHHQRLQYLEIELKAAVATVRMASFVSRSLQVEFVNDRQGVNQQQESSLGKEDNSPVTIADFAVQALIIDRLSQQFPDDCFVAEEDSKSLQLSENKWLTERIVKVLETATGEVWTANRLFATLDRGSYNGSFQKQRIWVLDPIDGTKGFIRGEHYCVALALLVDGKPELSVLGCPKLDFDRVRRTHAKNIESIGIMETPLMQVLPSLPVFSPSSGSLYFAVTGQGAHATSLGMPLDAAFEVQVTVKSLLLLSSRKEGKEESHDDIVLCESVEASHGNRAITKQLYAHYGVTGHDFIRLDGQCKYCVVGCGVAHGNLRLPPSSYQEKCWDHVPGSHFVQEAGGIVTDLDGRPLDFREEGRLLPMHVRGIVATGGDVRFHNDLVQTIQQQQQKK